MNKNKQRRQMKIIECTPAYTYENNEEKKNRKKNTKKKKKE